MRSAMRLRDGRPQASARIDPNQKPVQNALGPVDKWPNCHSERFWMIWLPNTPMRRIDVTNHGGYAQHHNLYDLNALGTKK
jgi:hypothetical protein